MGLSFKTQPGSDLHHFLEVAGQVSVVLKVLALPEVTVGRAVQGVGVLIGGGLAAVAEVLLLLVVLLVFVVYFCFK